MHDAFSESNGTGNDIAPADGYEFVNGVQFSPMLEVVSAVDSVSSVVDAPVLGRTSEVVPQTALSDRRTSTLESDMSELRYSSMLELLQRRNYRSEWWKSKLIGDSNPLSALLGKDIKHRIVTNMCDFRTPDPNSDKTMTLRRLAATGSWDWDSFYSSQNIDTHRLQYLRSLGCFNMPKADRMGYLLDIYFSRVHPILPILDKGELLSKIYGIGEPPPLVLLQAMFLAASRYATPDDNEQPKKLREECDKLHTRLRALIDLDLPSNRSAVLRASLIASFHWEGREGVNSAIDSLSLAVRIGQEMGLHRRQADTRQMKDGQNDMTRRIWWCLYAFDRFNAAQEGTPLLINERDCNIDELQESDLVGEDLITRQTTLFNISLSQIIEKAIRELYGPDASQPLSLITARDILLSQLDNLARRINENLCTGDANDLGIQRFWCDILKVHLLATQILVLRPFILVIDPRTNIYPSRDECRTKAAAIISSLSHMRQQDLLRYSWPFTVYALVNALLIIWYDVSSPLSALQSSGSQQKARQQLIAVSELLEAMGHTWWAAAAKHKLSEALLRIADTLAPRQEHLASSLNIAQVDWQDNVVGDLASSYGFSSSNDELSPNGFASSVDDTAFWESIGLHFENDVAGNIFSIF